MIGVAAERRWVDRRVRKRPREELWIALKVHLEQIDTAPMEGHRRRVWQIDPVVGKDLETPMFAIGMASVRLEHHTDRRKPIAVGVGQRHAELHEELQPRWFERLARSHCGIARRLGAKRHQMTCGNDLPL